MVHSWFAWERSPLTDGLWIPYLAVPVGLALMCLQFVAEMSLVATRRADPRSVGNYTAALNTENLIDPRLKAQFAASFPQGGFKGIHWYPAIPPGLEEMEGRVLDRIKAAN